MTQKQQTSRTAYNWAGYGRATRREQKHELLLTFMANARNAKQKPQPAPVKLSLLKSLLSFFL